MEFLGLKVFEYRRLPSPDCYNKFFNPNVCHVCKGLDCRLSCDKCRLVSYCGKTHKEKHQKEHEDICIIVARYFDTRPQSNARKFTDWHQWIKSRKEIMKSIEQYVGRPLEMYVKQMIMWTKTCIVCYQQNKLGTCKCLSVNYCQEHKDAFKAEHNEDRCKQLTVLLNINIHAIYMEITDISYKYVLHFDENTLMRNMHEFYILARPNVLGCVIGQVENYIQSEYTSRALSVYSGLKKIESMIIPQEGRHIIHIIAANPMDRNSLPAWELLLHLPTEMWNLSIIMIGPELLKSEGDEYKLCRACDTEKRHLSFIAMPMLYHDYMGLPQHYKKANVIVGFHVELDDTWSDTVRHIQAQGCPLLLTSPCEQVARNNILKMQEILNTQIEPDFTGANNYSGLRPHRDLEDEHTYFHNEHLTVYKNLYHVYIDRPSSSSSE